MMFLSIHGKINDAAEKHTHTESAALWETNWSDINKYVNLSMFNEF